MQIIFKQLYFLHGIENLFKVFKPMPVEKGSYEITLPNNILALNKDDFNNHTEDIYPAELSLNKSNIHNKESLVCTLVHNPAWEELGLILHMVRAYLFVCLSWSGAGMSVK